MYPWHNENGSQGQLQAAQLIHIYKGVKLDLRTCLYFNHLKVESIYLFRTIYIIYRKFPVPVFTARQNGAEILTLIVLG